MFVWASSRTELESYFSALKPSNDLARDAVLSRQAFPGVCCACKQPVDFQVSHGERPGEWRNLLEGMICPCGTNGRTRMALEAWRELHRDLQPRDTLIFERVTPVYSRLAGENPALIGCEFLGADRIAGQTYDFHGVEVRHENMLATSFGPDSLDMMLHFDVLEHVPDHHQALRECLRVLRPGGVMLFTVPFFEGLERSIVRARVKDGEIEHILPEAYHGNPVGEGGGALVFIQPGWELLDDIRAAGFQLQIGLAHNLSAGVISNGCPYPDGHMWPVIFKLTKPATA